MQSNNSFWDGWELAIPIPGELLDEQKGLPTQSQLPRIKSALRFVADRELPDSTTMYLYSMADGKPLMYRVRLDWPEGGKDVLPLTLWRKSSTGKLRWRIKDVPAPRPLFGLELLAARPDAPVLIVEGERCAESGRKHLAGYATTTWPGGAERVKGADWTPLSAGHTQIYIWPDNDKPGLEAAQEIARLLPGCDVKIVRPDAGWPRGHDIADLIAAAWDSARLVAFICEQSVAPPEFADYVREREVKAVCSVLADVLTKLDTDTAAYLSDEAVEAVARLKELDIAEYARYENELKKQRCNLTLLKEALRRKRPGKAAKEATERGQQPGEAAQPEAKESQAKALVDLARSEVAELFRDGDSAYALVTVKTTDAQHREVWSLRSRGFRQWLARMFFVTKDKAAGGEAMSAALNTLEGFALFGTEGCPAIEHKVNIRVAESRGKVYLDMCDSVWHAIEIDSDGWRPIDNPTERGVYFKRARAMKALPIPELGGSLADLKSFINFASEDDFVLIVAWLVGALHPRGPYPILGLNGERGSAKSSASRYLRATIDPNISVARGAPKKVEDILIAASNAWVVSFDNLSYISQELSDAFCRLSTGGGLGKRELYTDGDEFILDAKRPQIFNGIEELATRGDLVDRLITSTLNPIEESKRREESELDGKFEAALPKILGALLNTVSAALRNRDSVKPKSLPRMADFARWVVAAESACPWKPGQFLRTYEQNREEANVTVLEASIIHPPLMALGDFEGTATALLDALTKKLPEDKRPPKGRTPKGWPTNARAASGALRRLAPALRRSGINVVFLPRNPDKKRTRILKIEHRPADEFGNFVSEPSAPSGSEQDTEQTQDHSPGTGGRKPDEDESNRKEFASAEKLKQDGRNSGGSWLADDADAKIPDFSQTDADNLEPDEEAIL